MVPRPPASTRFPYTTLFRSEGSDLNRVLKRDGAVPPHDAVVSILQASEALAEAHAAGIIHRDLKPANLFLATQPDGSASRSEEHTSELQSQFHLVRRLLLDK